MKLNVNIYNENVSKSTLYENIMKNNPILFVIPEETNVPYIFDALNMSEDMLKTTYLMEELDLFKAIAFLSSFDLEKTKCLMMIPSNVTIEETREFSSNLVDWLDKLKI